MKLIFSTMLVLASSNVWAATFDCTLTVNADEATKQIQYYEQPAVSGKSEIEGQAILNFNKLDLNGYECVGALDRNGKNLNLQVRALDLHLDKEIISQSMAAAGIGGQEISITTIGKSIQRDRIQCSCGANKLRN